MTRKTGTKEGTQKYERLSENRDNKKIPVMETVQSSDICKI